MHIIRRALAASISVLALASAGASAQPITTAAAEEAAPGDTIVVIGSRRTDRTVADSAVPVDVISGEALTTSGYTETNRLLNQLVPSFNFPQPSITDGTDVIRPATLRGLSPDQTLVLVNGKRRHTTALLNINGSVGRGSAAVDINLIPSIAIERVEVLREGAAAQYGSDAIAGVINFELAKRRDFSGRVSVTYGRYESDVAGTPRATGLMLGANGQPTLAPDGTFNLATTGEDRHASDGNTLTVAATVGLPLGSGGYFNVSAEFQDRDATNRTGFDPRRQYALLANGNVDPRELTFNRLSHRFGDPATKDMKLFVNLGTPLREAVEFYAFGSYGYRDGQSGAFYRIASDPRNTPDVYPDGFLPLINTDLDDRAVTAGFRGEAAGWNWDLSGSHARNAVEFFITNTLNRSYGAEMPLQRAFNAGELRYTQSVGNLDVSRELAVGFLSELTLAGGLEYRRETFDIQPGEPRSYNAGPVPGTPSGAQGFPGFAPVIGGQRVDRKRSRHNWSAYAELDADVSDRFNLQLAGRYEDYSDFGPDWNAKIASRFELFEGLAVRGAVSTGFRAPSLQQQFYAAQATNNVNGVLLETVTLPVDNPIAIALGATPLDPETSISYSAGIVFNAVPRLNVTIDAYQVDIDDRIVVTDNLTATRDPFGRPLAATTLFNGVSFTGSPTGAAIATILNNAGFTATNAARFFVNGIDTRTRGLDAVGTYRFDLGGLGRLNATAGFNYNKTKIRRVLAAPGPLANVPGLVLFGRQESLRLIQGQPRTKVNASLDYDGGWLGATVRTNRYGKVLGAGTDRFGDVNLAAKWVTDLELRATLADQFDFAIGANNVFDIYPTKIPTGRGVDPANGAARNYPATNYVAPWSAFSPFGFNGRFLYARATARF